MSRLINLWCLRRRKEGKTLKGKGNKFLPMSVFASPLTLSLLACGFYLLPASLAVSQVSGSGKTNTGKLAQQANPVPAIPTPPPALRVVVNSNQDGNVQADNQLTLREAVELVNGTLKLEQLSAAEQAQVQPVTGGGSQIEFNLPTGATTIQLQKILPDLASANLTIDGTTQPGYDRTKSATAEVAIPVPVVAITTAANTEVFRGLTIVADGITVRGLSIYGFNASPVKQQLGNLLIYDGVPKPVTLTTPPGDIVVAHKFPPPDIRKQKPPGNNLPFRDGDVPPKNVTIEDNWLGLMVDEKIPTETSAFGVYIFNSQGTTIRRNRIYYHDGSAIITSVRGENTLVTQNIIVGNGLAGMPDALRFEGIVTNSQITGNLICANDGAGVYLFKPDGNVTLENNKITYNGRRLRRAAVYLMGSNHQVIGNQIDNQTGPGVSVSSFPRNDVGSSASAVKNIIRNNRFAVLEGLSIDLISQRNLDVIDFQKGDGANPKRDSGNRRLDTGNGAINAPEFTTRAFSLSGTGVTVQGKADPGSEVTIYKLSDYQRGKDSVYDLGYGALNLPLTTVSTDKDGKFSANIASVQLGDAVSAIATDPKYGTSEPAVGAVIGEPGTFPNLTPNSRPQPVVPPQCTSRPKPPPPEVPPEVPPPLPPPPLKIRVPRNIHFALDKSFVSPGSAQVLDRIADVLQQYPVIVIEIVGHTDPRASDAYNLALGRRRALATRNHFLRKGVAPERMTIRSLGESQLKVPGSVDITDYARDRRAEIIFKDIRGVEIQIEEQEDDLQIEQRRNRTQPQRSRSRSRRR
jgi:outer membrane protein OmpA-like peptidoglycan-associated protein